MTLELLLNNLCELAIKNNLVNYAAAGGSLYNLNGETIKDYPFIFISPTDEIEVGENTTTYGLTIFYCDRLLESKDNDTQIYSIATDTISNFLRQVASLDGIVDVADYTIRVFSETQKMNDSLNGAYARVRINVLNTAACAQWFDETGAPIGTYIPSTIRDVSVLENLASKAWVKQYVGDVGGDGISEEEANELIRKALLAYTKTNKFATINGSGITNNEVYALLETSEFREFLSGYTQEILEIRSLISASTPSDYDEVKGQVSANTQDIQNIYQLVESGFKVYVMNEHKTQAEINEIVNVALRTESPDFAKIVLLYGIDTPTGGGQYVMLRPYNKNFPFPYNTSDAYFSGIYPVSETKYTLYAIGFTKDSMDVEVHREDYDSREFVQQSAYTQDMSTLSAFTSGLSFTIDEHTEKIEHLETSVSGMSEAIGSISAQTSGNTAQIADLSGSTEQAVSSLTQDVVALSGATSDALYGMSADIVELSGATEGFGNRVTSLEASDNIAFFNLLKDYGDSSAEVARLYADLDAANASGKTLMIVSAFYKTTQDIAVFVFVKQDPSSKDYFGYGGGLYYDGSSMMMARAVPIIRNGSYANISNKNGHLYLNDFNSR